MLKYISFNKIPSNLSRFVPCRQIDEQTNMMKLIVAFRNFANAPRNWEKNMIYLHFF